jgi:glycosyltransferase involved in cell wall biosynthesis
VGPDKGDGSLGVTQAEAARLKLADRIEFTGRVPKRELAAAIHRGDIFINTTNIDNTPVTVLEAMACGACVVSTNVGGIPYMVQHGENGLLVPPDNAEAMAGAIGRILEEPELAARLSRNGRNTTEQIDWPRILTRWVDLLSSHARG